MQLRRPQLHRPSHGTLVAYTALVLALSGSAYAATGGTFILGEKNKAGNVTSLRNTQSGSALSLSTDAADQANLKVSNDAKITRLNADKLDGKSSGAYQRRIPRTLSFTALTLQNNWVGNCDEGGIPAFARSVDGVVHLHGSLCDGTNATAFTLPVAVRPSREVIIPVAIGSERTGQLVIRPDGTGTIEDDPTTNTGSGFEVEVTNLAGVSYTLPF